MLNKMQKWDEAATITYQHHERVDGKGYPEGLTENQIHDGAKILSIIDAFDAITQSRAYAASVKRPFIRAVLEINSQVGTQFSSVWVERFNLIVKKLHQHGMV
jgi:HD-GYP domain-containing protein (c-di-GMP phosphodiesterase class II)